jgi:PadR family transcriptional regulator AphA
MLLGEWACLGIIYPAPIHGFAVAARLKPDGDIGRVWSLSRSLTYRSIDQLAERGFVRPTGIEPGDAGPNRTILMATRSGRAALRRWLRTEVEHLRDLRSELLLKLVLSDQCEVDVTAMIGAQRDHIAALAAALEPGVDGGAGPDVVALWRHEASDAALRFLDHLTSQPASPHPSDER